MTDEYAGIEDVIETLKLYEQKGIGVGDFLGAVLASDLFRVFAHASGPNRTGDRLSKIVTYIYNRMPSVCWGSKEKVARWQECGGVEGGALERIDYEEREAEQREAAPTRTMAVDVVKDAHGVSYEPWTDGWAIGFRVMKDSRYDEYIYLNPSGEDDGEPPRSNVFLYHGPKGDPAYDEPVCFRNVFDDRRTT